jgi:hypothetical protein
MLDPPSPRDTDFWAFCDAVRGWLSSAPGLDPPLAAAAELLARRTPPGERELASLTYRTDDAHAALGGTTILSLWSAVRSGALEHSGSAQVGGA